MQTIISENGNLYYQWTTGGDMTSTTCSDCGQYISCPSCDDWICWVCGAKLPEVMVFIHRMLPIQRQAISSTHQEENETITRTG